MKFRFTFFLVFLLHSFAIFSELAAKPKNIVLILSDDHRYDYMGFHPDGPDFLNTPAMDRMAKEGAHIANAFVTTSLCSPSRASILTGQYAFRHGAVDNANPIYEGTRMFPEQLQKRGYDTAFFGKWHIGAPTDDPQTGFTHWASFRGQGPYRDPTLNINGDRKQINGYTTDILTDLAIEWMDKGRNERKPFMVYLSHKAVHSDFQPAERHRGMHADANLRMPRSMEYTESNYEGKPNWVYEQRFSWHGVDYMYHSDQTPADLIADYSDTLMGVDDSVDRVLNYLVENDLDEDTLVLYMGDNGFMLGEHGLIDKRQAYEESMRVPLIAWAPGFIKPGTTITENILNIDLAPTFLDIADGRMPDSHHVDGRSFLPILANGKADQWRSTFVYQYYWEFTFPQTPTVYAIRSERYKYIFYHGLWDKNELYDLQTDPREMHNLIELPSHQETLLSLHNELFDILGENGAMDVTFRKPHLGGFGPINERKIHPNSHQ